MTVDWEVPLTTGEEAPGDHPEQQDDAGTPGDAGEAGAVKVRRRPVATPLQQLPPGAAPPGRPPARDTGGAAGGLPASFHPPATPT